MMKENIKDIIEISKNTDRVFYFMNAEGKILNQEATQRIASDFADELELGLYATRSGPNVQNPKTLLEEVEELGLQKFEIVCLILEGSRSVVLSHDNKEKFVEELKTSELNCGAIAQNIIFNDDENVEMHNE